LISGIIFRNLPWFREVETQLHSSINSLLKKFCLVTILSIAGLSIDTKTLKLKIFQVLRLVIIPQICEAVAYLVFSHLIFGYDYFFGFTFG